jgi:hypothetical protein
MRLRGTTDRRGLVVISAIVLIALLAVVASLYFFQPI